MHTKPHSSLARSEYLIDRHLVVFESGVGSHCVCAEFRAARECRHTRESDGRRAAQELIAERVRSVRGTLVPFANRASPHDVPVGRHERTLTVRSLTQARSNQRRSTNW